MIISIGKRKNTNKKTIELEQHIIKEQPSYLSYIDNEAEHIYSGEISKNANGYIGKLTETVKYNVETEVINTYSYSESHYSYIDKDGYARTFNKLDTLRFDEESNTYFGIITDVHYEDKQINIFEEVE